MRPIFLLPGLLVVLNWLWPLPLPLVVKVPAALAIMAGSQFHFWARLSSGSPLLPEFPRPLIILFNIAFAAVGFLALFQLVLDLGWLVSSLLHGRWTPTPPSLRLAAGSLAAILAATGVFNALRLPGVRTLDVVIPDLPADFEGYRLLQLSDLHLTRLFPAGRAQAIVTRANAVGADLIVITGDFIDGTVAMRRADVAPLKALHAPDGVMAVPGNHEYYFGYQEWMRHLPTLGIRLLLNTHALITRHGSHLAIAGVTDSAARHTGEAPPDLTAALSGLPPQTPIVLLDHQPRHARQAEKQGVALQLSGHTHGGMILGLDRLVARGNAGFVSGRYDLGRMTLYVSNGTGLWPGFAVRLGKPGEMTLFRLHGETVARARQ